MRTFFGNTSAIILGLCLGTPMPMGIFYTLFTLLETLGLASINSMSDAVVVSGQPEFTAMRMLLAAATVYFTAFMVANLALSHKNLLALLASLPIINLAFLATLGTTPEANPWIDLFMVLPLWAKALYSVASLTLIAAYLFTAWAGAQKGIQTQNLFTSRWEQRERYKRRRRGFVW